MAVTETTTGTDFGRLTPEGIARFREKTGVDWPYTRRTTWNEEATRDGIRHYAYGFGDDNPLWTDPDHAARSRWGRIIAPPGFLEGAGLTPALDVPEDHRGRGKAGLSGVHIFCAAHHIRFFNPVHLGPRSRAAGVRGDIIAWLMGNGRHEIFPYRLNWQNRQRMGGFYSRNEFGAWDSAMRVHWDDDFARSVGGPRAYDYGMLRNAWLMHSVTDWMGDDAVIVAVDDRIQGVTTIGALTRLEASAPP